MIFRPFQLPELSDFFGKTTQTAASPFLRFYSTVKRGACRQNKGCF